LELDKIFEIKAVSFETFFLKKMEAEEWISIDDEEKETLTKPKTESSSGSELKSNNNPPSLTVLETTENSSTTENPSTVEKISEMKKENLETEVLEVTEVENPQIPQIVQEPEESNNQPNVEKVEEEKAEKMDLEQNKSEEITSLKADQKEETKSSTELTPSIPADKSSPVPLLFGASTFDNKNIFSSTPVLDSGATNPFQFPSSIFGGISNLDSTNLPTPVFGVSSSLSFNAPTNLIKIETPTPKPAAAAKKR